MKRMIALLLACLLLTGCAAPQPEETVPATTAQTDPPETQAPTETVPETTAEPETQPPETTQPVIVELTEEEKELLLKIGMAELGSEGCEICIALVMCTVLNRVSSGRFSKSIRGVLYAEGQFTPVMDGSFETAVPSEVCYEALDMVVRGWDESRGALYYEFCQGESWHSRNLHLLTEHCNTRFYD